MEDIRTYRDEEDERRKDDERWETATRDEDEVPFHIPRD